jgi:Tol biopolymer transport system component/C-terminal processing protease CtpA/Prc
MKFFLAFFIFCSLWFVSSAGTDPTWLRYPAISPDGKLIVFTYRGDLWLVPSSGGEATPLTFHEAHDFMPVWSHDSKTIAFSSDRFGNFDIFSISLDGGTPKRLTYHSAPDYPYDFTADNQFIIFGSTQNDLAENRQFPTGSQPEVYQVSVNGGKVQIVLTTPAEDISLHKNGNLWVYHDKKGGENSWRKHQVSAIARDLWLFNQSSRKHTKLTSFPGEDRNPLFSTDGKSVYYLSEQFGSFNVCKLSPDNPSKIEQVTKFAKHPVRFLSQSNEGVLCFSFDGSIYTRKEGSSPKRVAINLSNENRKNNEQILTVKGGARGIAVSPDAKEVAFVYRGDVFVTSVEGSRTKQITTTPEQELSVSFSPDGKSIIYSSERGNKWQIFQTSRVRSEELYFSSATLLSEKLLFDNANNCYQPLFSPNGKEVAFIENRMTLKIWNKESGLFRSILNQDHLFAMGENDQYFAWSPDNKWLLFDYSVPGSAVGEIGLVAADGKSKPINITESGFQDFNAKWALNGEAVFWFSNRDGLKSVAQSGNSQLDIYALYLTKEAFDTYRLSKEELALSKEMADKKVKKDSTAKKDSLNILQIDWEHIDARKVKWTLGSTSISDALVSKDGENLYYLAKYEKGFNLWSLNLRTKESKMLTTLNATGGNLVWDKDHKNIFLNASGALMKINPESGKQESISVQGEMVLNVDAERLAMFHHVCSKTERTFYTQSFHGVPWNDYKTDYLKFLPHISNGHEFAELLSELLGELNISHSGARYFSSNAQDDETASLGVFFDPSHEGNGWKIKEIIVGGPFDKAALNISQNAVITGLDGVLLNKEKDLAVFLNRKAGKNVLISVLDSGKTKELVIQPISPAEESRLLYKRWVKRNQEEVERLSQGKLGYIHIPGMSDGAYRTVFEETMGKFFNKSGLVVDTRFNGGGDLVADLATFFSGKKFMDYAVDNRSAGFEPNFRWTKPIISLANEANYSDGHCYAYMIKDLNLGKLVGQPIPGTCTFAGWEVLQDNSIRWGVPPLGVKGMNNAYLENKQTYPDVSVWNDYEKVSIGKDQQLEEAIKLLLAELK